MGYVDTILEPGEQVKFRTTLSWTLFLPAIGFALAAVAALILTAMTPAFALAGLVLVAIFAAAAVIAALHAWFRRWTTEIAVTDRRVVLKRGFIRRHTVEMNMQKVESVDVDQTQWGRLLDYGSVTIRGVGSTFERLDMVDAPLRLRSTNTAG